MNAVKSKESLIEVLGDRKKANVYVNQSPVYFPDWQAVKTETQTEEGKEERKRWRALTERAGQAWQVPPLNPVELFKEIWIKVE